MNWLGLGREAAALIGTPIVLFITWFLWIKKVRGTLPPWRNGLGLAALATLSISWAAAVLVDLPVIAHHAAWTLSSLRWITFQVGHTVDAAALALAFALNGGSRVAAALSAVLMLTCWPGGYS